MRWLWRRCQWAEVKPWTWPIEGGPPNCSSQPAPPTGGREMRVEHIGLEAAGGGGQARNGEQVRFAADAEAVERHVGGEQFVRWRGCGS